VVDLHEIIGYEGELTQEVFDELWQISVRWEVGNNRFIVPHARDRLIAFGPDVLPYISREMDNMYSGLAIRAFDYILTALKETDPEGVANVLRENLSSDEEMRVRIALAVTNDIKANEVEDIVAGILDEDDRVELLDGQIVEMTPIGGRHSACVYRLSNLLSRRMGANTGVSTQNPVVLAERWEPQPDLAVLRRPPGASGAWLPEARDVLLVIEVADTSLERDRDLKIPRYAAAGIPEAWLVDLDGDAIKVCREPGPEGYRDVGTVTRGATLRPLLLPEAAITADEILG